MQARPTARTYRRRRLAVGAVALAIVGAVVALVVSLVRDPGPSTGPASSTSSVAPESGVPATDAPTSAPTVATTAPAPADGLAVDHLAPPPLVEPAVIARLLPTTPALELGVMRDGWVAIDVATSTATVYDRAAAVVRTMPLDVLPSPYVIGPDDVLYGMTAPVDGRRTMVAIPLDGLVAGQIVAQAPVVDPAVLDLPVGSLGLGPDGVVDTRGDGATVLMPYLALDGTPVTFPEVVRVSIDGTATVTRTDGLRWPLRIERAPTWTAPADGAPRVFVSPSGAVYETTLEAPADDTAASRPVIAQLLADGSGQWFSLPDGWHVAASGPGGTLLRRDVTSESVPTVEVAWFP